MKNKGDFNNPLFYKGVFLQWFSGCRLIMKEIRVDLCSKCHPFFTGDKRILDAEGRVEKFKKKYR